MRIIGFLILFMSITSNTFAIDGIIVKTIDYSFKDKWNYTLDGSLPKMINSDTVFKKQYFAIAVIASNYNLDTNGISNVLFSIKITKPDNSVYFQQENFPLVKKKILNKDLLQMSETVIKMCFEENDALGVYRIQIEIIDKLNATTKKVESDILLAELPSYDHFKVKDEKDFTVWLEKYYENPQPESALSYYLYFSQSSLSEKESTFWIVFSAFLEIMKNNNYLAPQIIDCYRNQDLKTRISLLYLIIYSNLGTNEFYESLKGEEKNTYFDMKDSQMPDIYDAISEPIQMDMLWSTFIASGSYKPILKLIQTLDYSKYQGYLDNLKDSKQTDEDIQNATNNAIYNWLVPSLKNNCIKHELVLNYCKWAYQYEKLSDVQRNELKRIISE